MVFKKRWLFVMLTCILALSLLPACTGEKTMPNPKPTPMMPPLPVDEVSLEEAEEIIGVSIPTPAYLPPGCELQRVFIWQGVPRVRLLFSEEGITGEVQTMQDLALLIGKVEQPGASGGPKFVLLIDKISTMPSPDLYERLVEQAEGWGRTVIDMNEVEGYLPAKTVSLIDINEVKGYLSSGETSYGLQWSWSGFRFEVRMAKELAVEEIIKVAESIG